MVSVMAVVVVVAACLLQLGLGGIHGFGGRDGCVVHGHHLSRVGWGRWGRGRVGVVSVSPIVLHAVTPAAATAGDAVGELPLLQVLVALLDEGLDALMLAAMLL